MVHTEESIIGNLTVQLLKTQAIVKRLAYSIMAHSEHLIRYQRTLAPIRRVPEEIIDAIFLYVQAAHEEFPDPIARPRPYVLTLTQTCSTWRRIAIGRPQLWKGLSLSPSSKNCFNTVNLARIWLARAKDIPLSLQLKCTPVLVPCPSIPEELVAVAQEYFPNCRVLSLELSENTAEIYRRMGQKFVPRLEYLDINFNVGNSQTFPPIRLSTLSFAIAPCLRAVSILSTTDHPFDMSSVVLPWEQLTHLELGFINFPSVGTKTLKRCINLQECILHICSKSIDHWDTASPSVIFLPKLRSLVLLTKDPRALRNAFRIFTVPALEALEVVSLNHCFRGDLPLSDFMNFQRRSGFSLKGFIVIKMILHSDDIFRIMPSLRALALSDCLQDGPLLKALRCSSLEETRKARCMPMLEDLLVIDTSGHRAFRDYKVGMIKRQSGSSSHPPRWSETFSPRFMRDWDFRDGLNGRGWGCDPAESRWM